MMKTQFIIYCLEMSWKIRKDLKLVLNSYEY